MMKIDTPAEALEAAVDNWQAWLDDLPLPEEFSPGIADLQEFLRALAARIAEPVATVRPLVWPDFREGGTCGRPHQVQYFVTQDHDGNFWSLFDQQKFGSLAEAQANCEAHWQRTIVTTQPAAQAQAEARKDALREAADRIKGLLGGKSCGEVILALIDKESAHE